jgi:hypothetical protein
MSAPKSSPSDEIEHLLLNAQLRDELEPYLDESITRLENDRIPTSIENEYLASMLAWERAPALPISRWFEPELTLADPRLLSDDEIHQQLDDLLRKLHSQRIVLDFTDHLSDRQLYALIYRDILPSHEKKLESPRHFLHWDCADVCGDPDVWLRFYASHEERRMWHDSTSQPLPPREIPPYRREIPRDPL